MKRIKILLALVLGICGSSQKVQADCKDQNLRNKVSQTAKAEGVNENELLSIIAHESGCNYFTIAWNLPGRPETAKSRFFNNLHDAKTLAQNLIANKRYRVDVGIGQINNEAHLQAKHWSLDEVLNPDTALSRVAQVLKERTWAKYHSSNPILAKKWQSLAMAALSKALDKSDKNFFKNLSPRTNSAQNSMIVFNSPLRISADSSKELKRGQRRGNSPMLVFVKL